MLSQSQTHARDLAEQMGQRLKVTEAMLAEAVKARERLVADNESAVEGLMATISSKDQLLKVCTSLTKNVQWFHLTKFIEYVQKHNACSHYTDGSTISHAHTFSICANITNSKCPHSAPHYFHLPRSLQSTTTACCLNVLRRFRN